MTSNNEYKPPEISQNTPIDEIDRIYALQQSNIKIQSQTKISERIRKIKLLRNAVLEHREQLKEAMFLDYNKPGSEVDLAEMLVFLNELKYCIRNVKQWTRKQHVGTPWFLLGANSYIVQEAKGHCLVISPWNYPIHLVLVPLMYSYAAGNVTMIKRSEFTPNTSKLVEKIITSVFDQQEAAVVEGDVQTSTHILSLKWNHIFFTGSPKVGKIIMQAAAENLSGITLELGGKSPLIIDSSDGLKNSVKFTAATKFVNAGQYCIAPDYIYVHKDVKDRFVKKLIDQIKIRYGGNDKEIITTDFSHILNQHHTRRVNALIEESILQGATLEYGGGMDTRDDYIGPTIFSNVRDDMSICQNEIFGPVLYIKTFENIQQAIDEINKGEKPLSLYLFAKDSNVIRKVRSETSSGCMCINAVAINYYNYNLPFGGINNSGLGKGHGHHSFLEFSNAKAVLNQWSPWVGVFLMFPPFTKTTKRLIDWLLKFF